MNTKELLERANQIRNETKDGANTAERVGSLLVDMITFFSDEIDSSISVDKENVNAIRQSSSVVINVTSNTDWQVSQHPSWMAINKMIGSAGTTAVTITANTNTTDVSRIGNIDWETTDGKASTRTTVTQTADGDYIISSFSSPLNFDYDENGAGAQTGVVTSNKTVEVNTSDIWVKCENTGGNNYEIWTTPNSGAARSGSVTFRPQGVTTPSVMVAVTQDAYPSPKFEAVPADIVNVPASGGTRTVQLYCTNENWMLTYVPNWVNVEPNTGTGDAVLTVTIEPNTGAARNEAIQIDNLGTGATLEIGVYQEAKSVSYPYIKVADFIFNSGGATKVVQESVETNIPDLTFRASGAAWISSINWVKSMGFIEVEFAGTSATRLEYAECYLESETYPDLNKTIYIVQGVPPGISYAAIIPPADTGTIELPRSAKRFNSLMFCNLDNGYNIENVPNYMFINMTAVKGDGIPCQINVRANTGTSIRNGNMYIVDATTRDQYSEFYTEQSRNGNDWIDFASSEMIVEESSDAHAGSFTVTTAQDRLTASLIDAAGHDWITNVQATYVSARNYRVTYNLAANTTGQREAKIRCMSGSAEFIQTIIQE